MSGTVSLRNVTRIFSSRFALRGVNLEVAQGEAVALIGPNGSGKTTLLRLISTLLRPTSGEIRIFDRNPTQEAAEIRPKIGVLFVEQYLYGDLTVRENLELHAELHHIPSKESTISGWLERLNLRPLSPEPVRNLSKGERQRTALTRCLLHDPPLLLWDEPTSGLDEAGRTLLREIALESKRKKTVLCATHDLESIAGWADRTLTLEGGRLR
ncbi:MAG: ABC transporter ATP-binding protein [Pseudomonadota bacterium]